jgi:hypothetical protein
MMLQFRLRIVSFDFGSDAVMSALQHQPPWPISGTPQSAMAAGMGGKRTLKL